MQIFTNQSKYDKLTIDGDDMNINRINYISQFIVPKITKQPVIIEEKQEYLRLTKVTGKDNNMDRRQEHDAMYYYELQKDRSYINIKHINENYEIK